MLSSLSDILVVLCTTWLSRAIQMRSSGGISTGTAKKKEKKDETILRENSNSKSKTLILENSRERARGERG